MTNTYRIANGIANEIVNIHNAKYEALRERDFESYEKFDALEVKLNYALESFGYKTTLVYDEGSPMIYCDGAMAFKVIGLSISRIKEEN